MNRTDLSTLFGVSRNIFTLLHRSSYLGVALIDGDGRFLYTNDFFTEELGYPSAELIGMRYPHIISPLFIEKSITSINSLLSGEESEICLSKILYSRDGAAVPVKVYGYLLTGEREEESRILCLFLKNSPVPLSESDKSGDKPKDLSRDSGKSWGTLSFSLETGRLISLRGPFTEILRIGEEGMNKSLHIEQILTVESLSAVTARLEGKIDGNDRFPLTLLSTDRVKVTFKAVMILERKEIRSGGGVIKLIFVSREERENPMLRLQEEMEGMKEMISLLLKDISLDQKKEDTPSRSLSASDYDLTAKEVKVLSRLSLLKTAKEIAYEMGIAEITVRKHLTNIYRKLQVRGREELLLFINNKQIVN